MAAQKVVISKDLKADLQAFFASMSYDKLFILTDTNTQEKCYPLIKDIPALQDAPVITVQAGDTHKDIEQVAYIWSRLSNEGASRNSLLVNLGGGMITDMGGFAGATFKRGLRTVNIPTTLMASVDAAVGGKTGVNFNGLKNEVGSFYPPECVFIDCEFLRTLDRDNLLSGYAEMIATGIAKEEDVQNFARRIHSESSRLLSLIADIIQLSELDYIEGRDDFENVDLLDLAHATENSLAPGAEKYGIVISVEGEHFQTFGCRSQLEELIYNLCDNAIRYNKRNGKVSVTVFGSEGRPAISVEDTGIGIPEDKLDRVFERFFRVDKGRSKRTGGTGLGLAIVKHIALRHGAQISISSELGKGTKITVVFEENKGENSD